MCDAASVGIMFSIFYYHFIGYVGGTLDAACVGIRFSILYYSFIGYVGSYEAPIRVRDTQ